MAKKSKATGIVGIAVTALATCIAIGITAASISASNFVTLWWSSLQGSTSTALTKSEDQIVKESKEIFIEAQEEGTILYKNNKNTLPLATDAKVNLFGYYGTKTQTTVATSASIGSETISTIGLKDGLKQAGLQVNEDLFKYQTEGSTKGGVTKQPDYFTMDGTFTIKEFNYQNFVDDGYIDSAKAYSDTAIYVVSRGASEKGDAPIGENALGEKGEGYNYYQFTSKEQEWIDGLSANFEHLIVLLNSNTPMDIGWVEDDKIDAFLQIGTTGTYGTIGVGEVLNGTVNPSGHSTVTWAYDVTDNPAYYTYGDNAYSNASDWDNYQEDGYTNPGVKNGRVTSVDSYYDKYYHYYEGIYEGYRYYETRYVGDDNVYSSEEEAEYQKHVCYPFGYGLSYTSFKWSDPTWKVDGKGGKITATVKVTNTGSKAGKDVVQLYYTAPYKKGGIEKSTVVLGGYAKTKLLNAGESDTVTIEMNYDDMSSYDYKNEKAYVLDEGTYTLSLRSDAHTVKDNCTHSFDLASKIVYSDAKDGKRSTDEVAATNHFDVVSNGDTDEGITWVSRADWEGTMPKQRDCEKSIALAKKHVDFIKGETLGSYITSPSKDEERAKENGWKEITTNAKNGMTVDQLAGLEDYDSPLWDQLLDNLSIEEMRTLYADGAYRVASCKSIGMNITIDADAGTGLNATSISQYGTKSPSSMIWAASFNDELTEKIGATLGEQFISKGVVGVYGPTANLMASAFNGRGAECFSECPILTGKSLAAYVRGFQGVGGYVYMKHFAFYRMCGNASAMNWINEQAIRECYTRQFEIATKEADAKGMMISFSRIGTSLNTSNEYLLTDLCRNEWGFKGCFVSDGIGPNAWDVNTGLRAGLDLILDSSLDSQMVSYSVATVDKTVVGTVTGQHLMRESAKRLIYRYCNSAACKTTRDFTPRWIYLVVAIDVVMLGIATASAFLLIRPAFKKKKADTKSE